MGAQFCARIMRMHFKALLFEALDLVRETGRFLRSHISWVVGSVACLGIVLLWLVPHDGALHQWIMHERPLGLVSLARSGREWGKFIDTVVLCGGLFALGQWLKRPWLRRAALAGFLAASMSGLTSNVLRPTVGRARPSQAAPTRLVGPTMESRHQSFPSGHTATSGGYAFALAVAHPALAPVALLSGGWVVWSSFYHGSHYPSDILTSLLISGWIGVAMGLAARKRPAAGPRPLTPPTGQAALPPGVPPAASGGSTARRLRLPHWRTLLLLALLGALLLLPGTGRLPLMDRDEPRFAQATREMGQRNDWVIPTFNGEYRFDKPPLTYWLMEPGYRLLGENELGARLHAVLSTLLLAWLVFAFARALGLRPKPAAGAAAAMLFSVQFLAHGRAAVADMPMILCVTAMHYALYGLLFRTPGQRGVLGLRALLCASLCLGFLAKGPVAWLTPLLTLIFCRWVFRPRRALPWRRLGLEWVLPTAVFGVALWGLPALRLTQGEFWEVGIGFHVVERGMRRFHGRLFVPFYYPLTALFSLFPWSVQTGHLARLLRRRADARTAFLLSWLLSPMVIFLFYATQLPHYTLPGFPAFFLLLGMAWNRHGRLSRGWRIFGSALSGIGFAGAGLALLVAVAAPLDAGWRLVLVGAGLALGGLTLAPRLAPQGQPMRLLVPALVFALGFLGIAIGLRQTHVMIRMRGALDALPAQTECYVLGYREPSLVFYSRRRWQIAADAATAAETLARAQAASAVVVLEHEARLHQWVGEHLRRRLGGEPRAVGRDYRESLLPLQGTPRVAEVEGFSPARGVWVRLALYRNRDTN